MNPSVCKIGLLIALLVAFGCGPRGNQVSLQEFESSASQRLAAGDQTPISLPDFTDFSWDLVFVFPPYTPYPYIEQVMGFSWSQLVATGIASRDDVVLVVWSKNGEVVGYSLDRELRIDFDKRTSGRGLNRDEASFLVKESELDSSRIRLELADANQVHE